MAENVQYLNKHDICFKKYWLLLHCGTLNRALYRNFILDKFCCNLQNL